MTKEVNKWMHVGLEFQFEYKNKEYYLGPSFDANGKQTGIVFCEDYQDEILEVPNTDVYETQYNIRVFASLKFLIPYPKTKLMVWFEWFDWRPKKDFI